MFCTFMCWVHVFLLSGSSLAIQQIEHYAPSFFEAKAFIKTRDVFSAKTLNQCAVFCAKQEVQECLGFSWHNQVCSLGVLRPGANPGNLMVFANLNRHSSNPTTITEDEVIRELPPASPDLSSTFDNSIGTSTSDSRDIAQTSTDSTGHQATTTITTRPTSTTIVDSVPSTLSSTQIEKTVQTLSTDKSLLTTKAARNSSFVLGLEPEYPFVCSQVETEIVDLNIKSCNQLDNLEEHIIVECQSNRFAGLNMESGQYIHIEVHQKKNFDALMIEINGGFPDVIELRLQKELSSQSSRPKRSPKGPSMKAKKPSGATNTPYLLNHFHLEGNKHLYMASTSIRLEKSFAFQFRNMLKSGSIQSISVFDQCAGTAKFQEFVTNEHLSCNDMGKAKGKGKGKGKGTATSEIDHPASCQGFDCDMMLDDKLFTGLALPQTSIRFDLGGSVQDVQSVLLHFDPRTSIPKHMLLTNCDAQSQRFDLEAKSIFILILEESWETSCMDVTFGPEKYVHDPSNDIVVVQGIFWVNQLC